MKAFKSGIIEHNGKRYRVTNAVSFRGPHREIVEGTVEVLFKRRRSRLDACEQSTSRWIDPRGKLGRDILNRAFAVWDRD